MPASHGRMLRPRDSCGKTKTLVEFCTENPSLVLFSCGEEWEEESLSCKNVGQVFVSKPVNNEFANLNLNYGIL